MYQCDYASIVGGSKMRSKLFSEFQDILKEQAIPVLNRFDKNNEQILSASNIYTMVLSRIKVLRRAGFGKSMVLMAIPDDMYCIVDLLACCFLEGTYFPVNKMTLTKVIDQEFYPVEYSKISNDEFILKSSPSWHNELKLYPLMLATSGSVKQKLVSYHEEGILFQLRAHQKAFKKYNFEHKLSVLPKFHCFGMVLDLLLGLWMRQYITFLPGNFSSKDLKRVLENYEIDLITCVPRQVDALIFHAQNDPNIFEKLSNLYIFYGGAPLKTTNGISIKDFFKGAIEGYGLSEAGPGVLINGKPLEGINLTLNGTQLEIVSPSIADFEFKESEHLLTQDCFKYAKEYLFLGRIGDKIKNSRGTFETKLEVEKKISQKVESNIYLIHDKYQLKLIELYSKSAMSISMRKWIHKQYPSLNTIISLSLNENREILLKNNGKSNDDVLKNNLSSVIKIQNCDSDQLTELKKQKQSNLKNILEQQGRKTWAS